MAGKAKVKSYEFPYEFSLTLRSLSRFRKLTAKKAPIDINKPSNFQRHFKTYF